LKALFVATGSTSIMWWRFQNFAEIAWDRGLGTLLNPLWRKDLNTHQDWQELMPGMPRYDAFFTRAFVPSINSGIKNGAEAVVFQLGHTEGALDLFLSIKELYPELPLYTELDDLVTAVPTFNEAFGHYKPGAAGRSFAIKQLKESDGLIVSTPYLKEAYSEFNENIHVVPNSIDFKFWGKARRKSKPGIRIGWAGGSGHEGDFDVLRDVIPSILDKHKEVTFVFVNGPAATGLPQWMKGLKGIEHHAKWEPIMRYPSMIASLDFDIGIAPLVDSAFNRGKSNLKWLEGAALGYPVIASKVGHMKESVTSGHDGVLCETPEEWENALDALITNKKYRKSLAINARQTVEQKFNAEKTAELYISVLREAILKKKKPEFMGAA